MGFLGMRVVGECDLMGFYCGKCPCKEIQVCDPSSRDFLLGPEELWTFQLFACVSVRKQETNMFGDLKLLGC